MRKATTATNGSLHRPQQLQNTAGQNKKGGTAKSAAFLGMVTDRLEEKPQAELHAARIVRAGHVQKGAWPKVRGAGVSRSNGVELSVVEEIECLPAEFEPG